MQISLFPDDAARCSRQPFDRCIVERDPTSDQADTSPAMHAVLSCLVFMGLAGYRSSWRCNVGRISARYRTCDQSPERLDLCVHSGLLPRRILNMRGPPNS